MIDLDFYIPFPPTVNSYYIKGRIISGKGREFRLEVAEIINEQRANVGLVEKLWVGVILYMPDSRRRDLDNYMKSLLDSLTHAGVWEDDKQIDQLNIARGTIMKGGLASVYITEAGPVYPPGMNMRDLK